LIGTSEGKRLLGRSGDRNIKTDLREIEWKGVDRVNLARDRKNWHTQF
jgi:hypothetical protein